ncbi:hypothetical protein [Rhodococcus sp. OK302]|uniref:hypothetical protein n=1 Tax=Rhodococcus sp. OK302 TaxID=1882769 RepID=UPI0011400519|nr:hypothetical protein [Rhodococcus sp. OK302]
MPAGRSAAELRRLPAPVAVPRVNRLDHQGAATTTTMVTESSESSESSEDCEDCGRWGISSFEWTLLVGVPAGLGGAGGWGLRLVVPLNTDLRPTIAVERTHRM